MTDIAAANVTYTGFGPDKSTYLGPKYGWLRRGYISFGNGVLTYPSGGIPLTKGKLGCPHELVDMLFIESSTNPGNYYEFDRSAAKIRIFENAPSGTISAGTFTGDAPTFTGDAPAFTGDKPTFTGDALTFTGDALTFTGDKPTFTGDAPAFTGDAPKVASEYVVVDDNSPSGTALFVCPAHAKTPWFGFLASNSDVAQADAFLTIGSDKFIIDYDADPANNLAGVPLYLAKDTANVAAADRLLAVSSFNGDIYIGGSAGGLLKIVDDDNAATLGDAIIYDDNSDGRLECTTTGNANVNIALQTSSWIYSTPTGNVAAVTGNISTVTGNVSTPTGNVSTPTGNISTVTGNVAAVTGNISAVTGNLSSRTFSGTDAQAAELDAASDAPAATVLEVEVIGW